MLKRICLFLVLSMLVVAAAPIIFAKEPVVLDLWSHWGSEQRRPTINKIVATWNEAHPDVQVKYTFVPFDQKDQKYLASVAAGNPCDVIVTDIRTVAIRAAHKQNTDLTKYGAAKMRSAYAENLWNTVLYKGRVYALPFVTDTRVLFYDKDAFKEVGLDPEKPPATWKEFEEYAAKLDKKDADGKYVRIGFSPRFSFGYDGWVPNAGGSFWDRKFERPQINSKKNIEVLQWMKNWVDKYGLSTLDTFKAAFGGQMNSPFIAGKTPFHIDVITYAATIKKYKPDMNYGMAFIPTPNGKQHKSATWGGGFVVEVPRGAKHPKEAYEFAKYFTTEGATVWCREQYDIPAYLAAYRDAQLESDPVFVFAEKVMPYTAVTPAPFYAQTYGDYINKAVDDVLAGRATPKEALDRAQESVLKLVAQNKANEGR
ncbi:MAG: ABC transporter substrate-binding protein [Bacteroidota bacterium]